MLESDRLGVDPRPSGRPNRPRSAKLRFVIEVALVLLIVPSMALPAPARSPENWPWSSRNEEARAAFEGGLVAMDEGNEAAAREAFEAAVAMDPTFALAEALAARYSGGAKDAPMRLSRALAASATSSPEERIWIRALHAYEVGGDSEAELAAYRELVALRPSSARAHYLLGWALVNHGRWRPEEASVQLEVATRLDPDLPTAWNELGYARKATGDDVAAEAAFREYVRLSPDNANALDSLAEILAARGSYGEAERHYRRAVVLDPRLIWPRLGLAAVLRRDGRREEAEDSLRGIVALASNDRERRYARRALWVAAADVGDVDGALALMAAELARADAADERGAALAALEDLAVATTFSGQQAAGDARFDEAARRMQDLMREGAPRAERVARLRLAQLRLAAARLDRSAAHEAARAARLAAQPLADASRRSVLEEIDLELMRLDEPQDGAIAATPLSGLAKSRECARRGETARACALLGEILTRSAASDLELALARGAAWKLCTQLAPGSCGACAPARGDRPGAFPLLDESGARELEP